MAWEVNTNINLHLNLKLMLYGTSCNPAGLTITTLTRVLVLVANSDQKVVDAKQVRQLFLLFTNPWAPSWIAPVLQRECSNFNGSVWPGRALQGQGQPRRPLVSFHGSSATSAWQNLSFSLPFKMQWITVQDVITTVHIWYPQSFAGKNLTRA